MSYKVKLTPHAIEQLGAVAVYISDTLCAPETALRWSVRMKEEIRKLSEMPQRFKLVDEEPWRKMGIHKLPVQNFLVYFWINENEKSVWVTAIVYQKREQLSALMDMPINPME